MMRRWFGAMVCAAGVWSGCARADDETARELLNATLWMQRAPEYRALAQEVYRMAGEKLASAGAGTAAVEQANVPAAELARLPTAVVLDLDETVLDNTAYQARLLRDHSGFNLKSWGEWINEGAADAIPGAREYIATARALGHTVFYITNRDCGTPAPTPQDPCPAKTATLRNLVALGIDPKPDPERMLVRGERPEWNGGSKTHRRAFIAANYRIVALVGDDLGDVVDPTVFAGDRERLEKHFGADWFILPNPIYGSWAASFDSLDAKYAGLRTDSTLLDLPGGGAWKADARSVRIATWNIEYLMRPETQDALKSNCVEDGGRVPGDERTLPCAITHRSPRTPADFAALRNYAAKLNPDIVALEEVDGPDTAALVFPGYDFCFSTRAHVQKNGFAIRRGLPHRCEAEYEPLSLDDRVRRGVVATFFPGTANEFQLMAVHLKSGCPAGPLTAPGRNCELISRQVAPLEAWIEAEARAGRRFGLLGDFNRRFTVEKGPAKDAQGRQLNVLTELDDGDPPASKLTNVTGQAKFTPCTTDSEYREFIDNILLGRDLAKRLVRKSFVRVVYDDTDAREHWLSDHCPVGVSLRLD